MRPAKKGRIGTIMVTPTKLPANDSLTPDATNAVRRCKLSANAQFQDRPGACKLIETAVSRGDQTMVQRLADCRANMSVADPAGRRVIRSLAGLD